NIENLPRMNMENFPRMRMEDMRIPMEDLQRMRLEEMPRLRENLDRMQERLRDMPMQMREFDMAPMRIRLREDGNYRTLSPSRIYVRTPEGGRYIYRDSTRKWTSEKTKQERIKADKEKTEKEKGKN
ncbi:MAG: hypothetical protein ACREIW_05055, partial [Chthoniobacterales bacterium]